MKCDKINRVLLQKLEIIGIMVNVGSLDFIRQTFRMNVK